METHAHEVSVVGLWRNIAFLEHPCLFLFDFFLHLIQARGLCMHLTHGLDRGQHLLQRAASERADMTLHGLAGYST